RTTFFLRSLPSSSFLFSLIQRPPISTLFPYTTLFRSTHLKNCIETATVVVLFLKTEPMGGSVKDVLRRSGFLESIQVGEKERKKDRKSTRLNSSHVKISYAVFCLKKKNKIY